MTGKRMNRTTDLRGRSGNDASRRDPAGDAAAARPTLPLTGCAVRVDACGGIARIVLTQRFVNPHAEPLVVMYRFPLPADAALSGYGFSLGGSRVIGRVEPRAAAREHFEAALMEGRPGAIIEQDGSS